MGSSFTYRTMLLAVVLGYAHSVQAQTVDYGSLQTLFGEPVTTSATGTPQRASEAPANMTIITADEIRQSGSRNIPDILSRVPGLDILQGGNTSFDVGVRGYQAPFQPRLLVLVDGRQVFVDDYSRTIWDNIPVNIDDIRQIEVVKGASSALFGSNAAGGVINIVTYNPLYDDNNVVSATVGSQHTFEGDGTATVRGDWGGSKTSAGGLKESAFSTPIVQGLDSSPENPFHQYITNTSLFKVDSKVTLDTEFNYSKSGTTTNDLIDNAQSAAQKTTTYSVGGGVTWDTPYGQITNNNYLNHSYVSLVETPTDDGAPYGFTTNLIVSQLQDQFTVADDHTFRIGVEYRYKDFKNDGIQLIDQAPALSENNYAVSGSWLWQINPQLSWTNAGRVDYQQLEETGTLAPQAAYSADAFSHNIAAFTANSDFVYKPTDKDSFRVGYGRGVQMPSLLNYGFAQVYTFGFPNEAAEMANGGFPTDYEGNPDLKPTYVQDYSADYDRKIDDIYSHLKVSAYYELNQDVITSFQASPETFMYQGVAQSVYTPANIGNTHGWGGEIELKGSHPSGFRWDASYSYSRVVDSAGVATNLDYQGSAPINHFRLLLGYTTGPWEFDVNGQAVTSTDMLRGCSCSNLIGTVYTRGYESLAGRVGYKITDQLTVGLSGTNITTNAIQASPYPAIERQVFGTLTYKFSNSP